MPVTGKIAIRFLRPALLGLLCLIGFAPMSCVAENLRLLVVLSDNAPPYQAFYKALQSNLPASIQVSVLEHPEGFVAAPQADLIVAVGMKATEVVAAKIKIPVLGVMIPNTGYEQLIAKQKDADAISAIYLNQPWARQLDFLRAALPERRKIGLLYSPDTHIDLVRLRKSVADRGGLLSAQPVRSATQLFSGLEDVLANCDVLLAVPDSAIYSSGNIRNILLTSYRHNIPLIGFSQAFVNAGALAAIFSTPEQLAEQTSETVVSFARTSQLPAPQYPETFTVSVNQEVARSLGIEMRSPDLIHKKMNKEKEGSQ